MRTIFPLYFSLFCPLIIYGTNGSAYEDQYNNYIENDNFIVEERESYSNLGISTGDGTESFIIMSGENSGEEKRLELSYRSRTSDEAYSYLELGNLVTNDNVNERVSIISNIFKIEGMGIDSETEDGRIRTDPYALQATYNQEDFDATFSHSELMEIIAGNLFLGWLNSSLDNDISTITNQDYWVHSVQGNFLNSQENQDRKTKQGVLGNAIVGTLENYIEGTHTSFPGTSKESGEIRVGDHGGDVFSNTVWSILDHNSDFAVAFGDAYGAIRSRSNPEAINNFEQNIPSIDITFDSENTYINYSTTGNFKLQGSHNLNTWEDLNVTTIEESNEFNFVEPLTNSRFFRIIEIN